MSNGFENMTLKIIKKNYLILYVKCCYFSKIIKNSNKILKLIKINNLQGIILKNV
jgi:hypothetical protein